MLQSRADDGDRVCSAGKRGAPGKPFSPHDAGALPGAQEMLRPAAPPARLCSLILQPRGCLSPVPLEEGLALGDRLLSPSCCPSAPPAFAWPEVLLANPVRFRRTLCVCGRLCINSTVNDFNSSALVAEDSVRDKPGLPVGWPVFARQQVAGPCAAPRLLQRAARLVPLLLHGAVHPLHPGLSRRQPAERGPGRAGPGHCRVTF